MINLLTLDEIIEAIGVNTFVDELLARMTAEDLIATVNEIAAEHGLEATIDKDTTKGGQQ